MISASDQMALAASAGVRDHHRRHPEIQRKMPIDPVAAQPRIAGHRHLAGGRHHR